MARASSHDADARAMLAQLSIDSVEQLLEAVPPELRIAGPLDIPGPLSDPELESHCRRLASRNLDTLSAPCFAGAGIYDHFVPATVTHLASRAELVTAYTAYQPELSQGMLAALYEYQTMLCELTGMDLANSSLYDGGTALTEAVFMLAAATSRSHVLLTGAVNPGYEACLRTAGQMRLAIQSLRPGPSGVCDVLALKEHLSADTAAVVVQHPNYLGCLEPVPEIAEAARSVGARVAVCFDPISLGILEPPGSYGADVAIGEGLAMCGPMSLGGPGLGLFACRREYLRLMPGRVVGKTVDRDGRTGYVNTLQTREQHIRREKATSNICTNQALCAVAAAVYMASAGPHGLRRVAELCLQKAHYCARRIAEIDGFALAFDAPFFKEFVVECSLPVPKLLKRLAKRGPFVGGVDVSHITGSPRSLLVAVTEKRTLEEIDAFVEAVRSAAARHGPAGGG